MFRSFLALAMQKRLDDLMREAGLAPEWRVPPRDLDRLTQARIRRRGVDGLARGDAAPAATTLFNRASARSAAARPPGAPPAARPIQTRPTTRRPPKT